MPHAWRNGSTSLRMCSRGGRNPRCAAVSSRALRLENLAQTRSRELSKRRFEVETSHESGFRDPRLENPRPESAGTDCSDTYSCRCQAFFLPLVVRMLSYSLPLAGRKLKPTSPTPYQTYRLDGTTSSHRLAASLCKPQV